MIKRTLVSLAAVAVLAAPAASLAQGMTMPAPNMDPAKISAGHYKLDPTHASIVAKVRHMGLANSTFVMKKFDASFDYDPAHPAASKVMATIDANSIDMGVPDINARFAKEMLGADKNPTVTFQSTGLTMTSATEGKLAGNLTMEGATKPVVLNVTFDGNRPKGGMGPERVAFSASGDIKRSDFAPLGPYGAAIGDNVHLIFDLEFVNAG